MRIKNQKITKMLMWFILVMAGLLFTNCKTQKITTTKTHVINDTIIYEAVKNIQLPVKNITIIESPCKGDSLIQINQIIKSKSSTLTIKNVDGNLVIEQNIDSIVNSKVREILKHTEKQVEITEKIITKTKWPKFLWWLLGINILYIAYRVARIYFPIIRFLPY